MIKNKIVKDKTFQIKYQHCNYRNAHKDDLLDVATVHRAHILISFFILFFIFKYQSYIISMRRIKVLNCWINGKVNPLSKTLFLELILEFID